MRLADRCSRDVFEGLDTQRGWVYLLAESQGLRVVLAGYTLVWASRDQGLCVHDVGCEAQGLIRGSDVGAVLDETPWGLR